jgi:hypothetical protein
MLLHPSKKMARTRIYAGVQALLATLIAGAVAPAIVNAQSTKAPKGPAFALSSPEGGALSIKATPGETRKGAVVLRSRSSRPVTVLLQAADVRTGSTGNAGYITERPSATGRWVDLAATEVRLKPGATRKVAFTVRVPAGASGASHYAGIVAVDAAEVATAEAAKKLRGKKFTIARINRQALPITVRLPGPLSRSLSLDSANIAVASAGAGLMLKLLPGGTQLISSAEVDVRVMRGDKTILHSNAKIGQLFPGSAANYRIPWTGRPTTGDYRIVGEVRPVGAAVIPINQTIKFTAKEADELKRITPPVAAIPGDGLPMWVWLAFAGGALLLLSLLFTIWKLARRSAPLAAA